MKKKDGYVSTQDAYSAIRLAIYSLVEQGESVESITDTINLIIQEFVDAEDVTLVSSTFPGMIADEERKSIGDFTLFPIRSRFSYKGKSVSLSPNENKLMTLFFDQPGITIKHDEIVEYIAKGKKYSQPPAEFCRPLLSRLKKQLSCFPESENWFETVRGKGYVFIGHEK